MEVKIIKKGLDGFKGDAWLIKRGRWYYIASGVHAMFSGWEVLIFPATKDGQVKKWSEVGGGRGISHEEAIERFAENGPY